LAIPDLVFCLVVLACRMRVALQWLPANKSFRAVPVGKGNRLMSVIIHIPHPLRDYCQGTSELSVEAGTIRQALRELQLHCPAVYSGICDETGAVRRHINLFVNAQFVRRADGLDTALVEGDILYLLPAVSGG
jgi:sulfur-carrier protein